MKPTLLLIAVIFLFSVVQAQDGLIVAGEERFLRNIKQLTFAGENAEAYFRPMGRSSSFSRSVMA